MFYNKIIMVTGGSGYLGQALTRELLKQNPRKIIVFSRDEQKQYLMNQEFNNERLRFFIGDVRDKSRLKMAMQDVDYVVHAAALKHVPILEYNPFEAIRTNIIGAMNVISAAISCKVKKVVAISTDKAVHPVNLYGSTKLCADKLFINGNALGKTIFSVVRYGNVAESTGSVIPLFKKMIAGGAKTLPITDARMTRFHITIEQAIKLIFTAFENMEGGEIYVSKIPSYKLIDLVKHFKCNYKIIGIRPGEKLHEIMITPEDAQRTYECKDYFVIYPMIDWKLKRNIKGKRVPEDFSYESNKNSEWVFK